MLKILLGLVLAGLAIAVILWLRKPTPEQRLARFVQEAKQRNEIIFETSVEGQPVTLWLANCKVYKLRATPDEVEQKEVLRPGFVIWFTGCVSQSVQMEDGYIKVELINQQIGAGGGNASGGVYRSRDAEQWEKYTRKGWKPVSEAQN